MVWRFFVAIPIAILAIGGSTACATKKFVRSSVGELNDKVDSLGRSVEETQERTRKNEGQIAEVDQRAKDAAQSARQAKDAAHAVGDQVAMVGEKVETIDRATRRLVYEVVVSEDEGNFKFGQTTLPDDARQRIDEMVQQLKQDPKNVYIEIEGHTDNVGLSALNEKIGLGRAQAVQRYLYEQYQIPLHKMNVISYGEEKPIAPNKTKAGRAQNRRVVIKVLA